MKSIGCIMVLLFFASCSTVHVNYDYEKETDFSNYTTYNYYSDMETGLNELDTKRLLKAVDSILRIKGLLLSEEPDFFINIQSSSFLTPRNNTVGVGVGGTGRNVGGGISIGVPIGRPKEQREIQFDFVDSQKDALFWQATSRSVFKEGQSPIERERNFQELVGKVFAKYPPKRKN